MDPDEGQASRMKTDVAAGAVAGGDAVLGVASEDGVLESLSHEVALHDPTGNLVSFLVLEEEALGGDADEEIGGTRQGAPEALSVAAHGSTSSTASMTRSASISFRLPR
jgi:hypothetical protein